MNRQETRTSYQSDSDFLPSRINKLLWVAFILLVVWLLGACSSAGEAEPSVQEGVNPTEAVVEPAAQDGEEADTAPANSDEAQAEAETAPAEADAAPADEAPADEAQTDAEAAPADEAQGESMESDAAQSEGVPPTFAIGDESSPTETPVPPPVAENPTSSPQVRILATLLNVRTGPSTDYDVITGLAEGEIVPVLARNEESTWYNIQLSDGNRGWIASDFAEPVEMGMIDVPVAEEIQPPPAMAEPGKEMPEPTAEPSDSSRAPSAEEESNSASADATVIAVAPTVMPEEAPANEPTVVVVEQTAVPSEPTAVPSEPTAVPSEPTAVPSEPTAVPSEPTAVPSEPTAVPSEPTATAVPAAPAAPAPSSPGGFAYGIQAHLTYIDRSLPFANTTGLGFGWIKQQVEWKVWEQSQGNIDWGEMDAIAQGAQANGLTVLYSVVGAPDWAREAGFDGSVAGPPANPATFANFLSQMAARYCNNGVGAIEVWNEQNLHYEWGNQQLDPAAYMALLKPAYGAIKNACPSMVVVSGALTPAGDVGNLAVDDITYLQGMFENGLAQHADVIGAHPSGYNVPPSLRYTDACAFIEQKGTIFRGPCDTPHHSWSFLSTLEGYRDIAQQNGANQRIWATEFGWAAGGSFAPGYEYADDNTLDEQAQWSVEAFQYMRNSGYVGAAFLWNLNFRVVADRTEKAQWGILANNTQPLPAYIALQAMAK